PARSAVSTPVLRSLAKTYRTIAGSLATVRGVRKSDPGVTASFARGESTAATLARHLEDASLACARIAFAPEVLTEVLPDGRTVELRTPRLLRDNVRALRDSLSLRSTYFRHAVRVAVAVTAAQLAAFILSPTHIPWVTMTTIVVLQPYPGATVTRAFERVMGTLLGSIVAIAITVVIEESVVLAATIVPLSIAAVATRPRSHHLFTLFLTPVFVLFATRWEGDWWVAVAWAGDAMLGGAIAVAAALLFPSREEKRLSTALDALLDAVRRYVEVVVEAQRARTSGSRCVVLARREVASALGSAETSLERLLSEPRRTAIEAEDAVELVTQARRLASAFTALDARPERPADDRTMGVVLAHVIQILDRGADIAMAPSGGSGVFALSISPFCARILYHAELLGGAITATVRQRAPRPA
ncbi:MAG: putative rane protein, partial [Labilithrix sp.]|nr:putative rane protein [Labilithrix sp.]